MKKKICFVLPAYAKETHFQYVAEFVESLADHADVFLVVEKGEVPPESKATVRIRQYIRFAPLRFLEIGLILLTASLRGYRTHYVHYSFSAACWSSLWTRLFGGMTYYWNAGLPWLYRRSWFRERFERLVFRMVGRLVTGANALVSGYASYYRIPKEKIIVIPNWIDPVMASFSTEALLALREELHLPPNTKVVLFVHRLASRKGADLLPHIAAGLDEGTVLLVVGDGPLRSELTKRFSDPALSRRVRLLGAVPQKEVALYFALSDVFILPSEEEGCPHVLLESLVSGVPYVAFAPGGVREMTPPRLRSYLYEYGEIAEFTQGIRSLLALSSSELNELKKEETEWVRQYQRENIMRQFLEKIV